MVYTLNYLEITESVDMVVVVIIIIMIAILIVILTIKPICFIISLAPIMASKKKQNHSKHENPC